MSTGSKMARSLFAMARADGPDVAAHDAVWDRVAQSAGIGTAIAATLAAPLAAARVSGIPQAAAAASKASLAVKLLAAGGLIGAVGMALGILITVTVVAPPPGSRVTETSGLGGGLEQSVVDASIAAVEAFDGLPLTNPTTHLRDTLVPGVAAPAPAPALAVAPAPRATDERASNLAEEVRLVTDARSALVRGEPATALLLVQATRQLEARALEPEELRLEARALHALGRTGDAVATELVLRRRYPDHALVR